MKCQIEQERYSCTLSLTSALDGDVWSTSPPGRFTLGKETRYPLYRRLNDSQDGSGGMRKIYVPPGFDPRAAQPIVSRYRLKYPDPHGVLYCLQTFVARAGVTTQRSHSTVKW